MKTILPYQFGSGITGLWWWKRTSTAPPCPWMQLRRAWWTCPLRPSANGPLTVRLEVTTPRAARAAVDAALLVVAHCEGTNLRMTARGVPVTGDEFRWTCELSLARDLVIGTVLIETLLTGTVDARPGRLLIEGPTVVVQVDPSADPPKSEDGAARIEWVHFSI